MSKPDHGWYTAHDINMIRFKAACWGVAIGVVLGVIAVWRVACV